MCGIAGVAGLEDPSLAVQVVERMVESLARRGPDGQGVKCWDTAVLGHRRLAIFDLTATGSQPMTTPDDKLGVVFNGAIYNYVELRDELRSAGHCFSSQTDTEVLLHGYRRWGMNGLVSRLRGMFAFALWDGDIRKLYLVRDRLGVKPLVYTMRGGVLAFASTVRALAAAGYAAELREDAVATFLERGFLPDDVSIYSDVQKVPAGSILEWTAGTPLCRKYWYPHAEPVDTSTSFRQAVEETRRLLLDSVRIRLRADVTVGALLSGGIDSALVCWAVTALGRDLRVYTVSTPGDPWDETRAARETAQALRLDHRVVEESAGTEPAIDDLVSAYAEPFGSASALGMLRVSRAITASSPIKVLLTGDGGDDVFLGYPRHRHLWIAGRLAGRLPRAAERWWHASRPWVPMVGPLRRAAALIEYSTGGLDGVVRYAAGLHRAELGALLGERLQRLACPPRGRWTSGSSRDVLGDFLDYEFNNRFVGEYLTKLDGATMHYGIEARSPFLDHVLWEFASSLPFDVRLHRGQLKAVLRALARQEIGQNVARRRKRGFGIPVHRWIAGRWRPWVEELLGDSLLEKEGWLRSGAAPGQLRATATTGTAPLHLWYVIVLESWLRHERALASRAGHAPPPVAA